MAFDWIKIRTDLYRDPKVSVIADLMLDQDSELSRFVNQNMQCNMTVTRNVMRNVTVGALVSVWGVLRHRGKRNEYDLFVKCCTLSVVDDLADLPGFGCAMASVGWIEETDEGIVLPRFFEEFNVDPAEENKAKNAERQRLYRERKKAESNVTRDVTVASQSNAREEKRRVNNNYSPEFLRFWETFPNCKRKGGRPAAFKAWTKHGLDSKIDTVIQHMLATICTDNPDYVPAPESYLNKQGWDGWSPTKSGDDIFAGAI
jgi:hypothetical protein